MPGKKMRLLLCPLVIAVVACVLFVLGWKQAPRNGSLSQVWHRWFPDSLDFDQRAGSKRKRAILMLGRAAIVYSGETGFLPHSPRGAQAALYQLRGHLDRGEIGRKGLDELISFDDPGEVIRNNRYDYLNPTIEDYKTLPDQIVILAERTPDENGGRWCYSLDGFPHYVVMEDESAKTQPLVGRLQEAPSTRRN